MSKNTRSTARFPFKVNKLPFFYGWVILLVGTLGVLMSAPGQTVGVSVFTDILIDVLAISRTQLSFAYMMGTGLSAFIMTFAGIFYDRQGARITAVVSSFGLALVLLLFSQIDFIVAFFTGLFKNHVLTTIVIMTLAFFLLRFFGQGVLTMVSRNMVMKWFDKFRGMANGILGVAISFGFSYAPRLFDDLIASSNWRNAWIFIAYGLFLFVVIAIVFFRDNPWDCNQSPDGFSLKLRVFKRKGNNEKVKDLTLGQTIRTYSFWIFNLGLFMAGLYVTAFTFHVVSIYDIAGYDKETALSIFLPVAAISVLFHLSGSFLSDFIPLKYLLMLLLIGLAGGMISSLYLNNPLLFKLLIISNGVTTGMFGTLIAVTWPKLYGTKHLGAISGFALSWVVAGSAVGPFILSLSYKFSQSYHYSFIGLGIFSVVLLVLTQFVKKYPNSH